MLLSPLGSPSNYKASLCLSLPPLQHHHILDEDDEDEDEDQFCDSSSSASDSDSVSLSDESSSSDVEVDVDVDVDVDAGVLDKHFHSLDVKAEPQTELHSEPEPLVLPVELIFAIVELAATHRRTAIALCRVASWVRSAVLPILYGTLVIHGGGPNPLEPIADNDVDLVPSDVYECNEARGWCGEVNADANAGMKMVGRLESPLRYVRSLWLDVPPDHAPRTLDACPRLKQLALPLEAHATICDTTRWLVHDHGSASLPSSKDNNALELDVDVDCDDVVDDSTRSTETCRSFTVLGQSHPHRWAPLTSSPNGRAFLRGVTHLRILNLCLSHYIPLEYTPNLTHLCIPFFDLRISPSSLHSSSFTDPSPTGSAATSSFTGLDYILAQPSLKMVVLTLNPRYWRFDELSLKGWAVRAMARDPRLYVVAATRDDATRDWDVPRRDWEDEAYGGMSVWDKAVCVRRKFLTRLSRTWETYLS
ncbi:hypothetical protein ACEPAG_5835 [Sanghuangporus baumii]